MDELPFVYINQENRTMEFKHYDLVLEVRCQGGGEEVVYWYIKCHKIFLMAASPFFKALVDKNVGDTIVIEEPNIKLFNILIQYIYTRQVDLCALDTDDIISLITLSSKYKLRALTELCGKVVNENICCIRHLVRYFNLAIELSVQCLRESCLKIIRQHAGSLFSHASFMTLSPQAVETITREDDLNISEMELFLTVLKWAEHKYPDFYNEILDKRYIHMTPINSTANPPFSLQSIENKLLSILKVEQMDSNMSGKAQLNALLNSACNNEGIRFKSVVEFRPDKYWIKIRHMLDQYNITKNIRFLALDPLEFSSKISSRNLLTSNELANVLMTLNSSDASLVTLQELSNIRKPRRTYTTGVIYAETKLRVHVRLFFEFLHSHIFNNETDDIFSEEFRSVSANPVLLTSIILPPKQRKVNCGNRYYEDIFIEIFKKSPSGEKLHRFASANYQGRRKYDENISLMLNYNIQDESDAVLHEGSEFIVEIANMSKGAYAGGLTRTSLNRESQFIITKDKIQKGIIAGFCFFFDIGM